MATDESIPMVPKRLGADVSSERAELFLDDLLAVAPVVTLDEFPWLRLADRFDSSGVAGLPFLETSLPFFSDCPEPNEFSEWKPLDTLERRDSSAKRKQMNKFMNKILRKFL